MTAIVAPQIVRQGAYAVVFWEALDGTTNTTGKLTQMPGFKLTSIQVIGTFGAAVTIVGTNDDAGTAATVGLKDRSGTAISTSAAAMFGVPEGMNWIQPAAASGVSDVDVYAFYERARS